ncbi:MAG: NAD-dependent epimerase/dehydratase family protein [Myxococcota bacterium]
MKVAVIGGSGFIGSRLVDLLSASHDVTIVDTEISKRHPDRTRQVDVRDPEALKAVLRGHDAVILLAAVHRDDISPTSLYYDVNVEGARNVAMALRAHGITRLVFTSSVTVYGLNRERPDETAKVAPFNDYGRSKYQAEQVLREWQAEDPAHALSIIRSTVVFGEGNRGNVYNLIRQLHSGHFVMVGPGTNRKSMAYVGNVAEFIQWCLETREGGVSLFNYTDQPDLDMNELVSLVRRQLGRRGRVLRVPYRAGMLVGGILDVAARLTGLRFPISAIRVRKFCATTTFSTERARRAGFRPSIDLTDAVRRTIEAEFDAASR